MATNWSNHPYTLSVDPSLSPIGTPISIALNTHDMILDTILTFSLVAPQVYKSPVMETAHVLLQHAAMPTMCSPPCAGRRARTTRG